MSKQYTNLTGAAVEFNVTQVKTAQDQASRSLLARRTQRQHRRSYRAL